MHVDGQAVLASLTLGGYDASRITRNDLTFVFAPDNERDLVVGLVGLTANTSTTSHMNLLERDHVTLFVDSTVAELWLPIEICKAFEDAFGLEYHIDTDLYLVDEVLHQHLVTQNPSITFTLGQKYSTEATVQITLPYAAFDLEASPPYRGLQEKTRYFSIRRGNESISLHHLKYLSQLSIGSAPDRRAFATLTISEMVALTTHVNMTISQC